MSIKALVIYWISRSYWQVLPQLGCGDTCQIWMWLKSNRCFCKIRNWKINVQSFSNPPLHHHMLLVAFSIQFRITITPEDINRILGCDGATFMGNKCSILLHRWSEFFFSYELFFCGRNAMYVFGKMKPVQAVNMTYLYRICPKTHVNPRLVCLTSRAVSYLLIYSAVFQVQPLSCEARNILGFWHHQGISSHDIDLICPE